MTDIEKVIRGLECCVNRKELRCINDCPYYTDELHYFHECWRPLNHDALSMLKAQESYSDGWISVEDKLPDKEAGDPDYTGYLIYSDGHMCVADYARGRYDSFPWFHVDGEYDPDVTHWMSLPEPPKEET